MKLVLYSADLSKELALAFADGGIRAGFPSPAQDYMGDSIDLNRELVRHPATTFYARADGEFTLKKVKLEPGGDCLWLMPANDDYSPIKVTAENHFVVWGVLTYNIKRQLKR